MQKFIILNQEDIAQLLTMQDVLAAVEKAYSCKCSKQAELFPLVCHSFEDGYEEFDIKSGSADDAGIFGMKLVSAFARNSDLGLPRLTGTILIFDRKTGMLRSMMDGGLITNMRTGAAGGVGCKVLAHPESETVLLVGTGAQGPMLLRAVLSVMRKVKRILVVNPHTPQKAKSFVEDFHQILAAEFPHFLSSITLEAIDNPEQGCRQADIILTATPARTGIIKADWIRPGTHLSCIGSDMEGKQELEEVLTAKSHVFCDDLAQVIAVGECEKAVKSGLLNPADITEIGDVLLGKAAGRQNDAEITIFDSTGIGLQDLMTASFVTELAEKQNLGIHAQL